jgi:hypothetical protein
MVVRLHEGWVHVAQGRPHRATQEVDMDTLGLMDDDSDEELLDIH